MNKRWKVITIALITMMALSVLPLTAQTAEDFKPSPESKKYEATQGNFTTDVDDYLNVHNYTDVEFDKWFGYAGLAQYGTIGLGYARKFGGIYVGAYYSGNIISVENGGSNESISVTYEHDASSPDFGKAIGKMNTITYTDGRTRTYNDADILVGFAGMGVKVGFFEYVTAYKTPHTDEYPGQGAVTVTENYLTNTTAYVNELDSYSYVNGNLLPTLGWGMKLGLGSITLKPYVDAAIGIMQNSREYFYKNYTKIGPDISGAVTTNLVGEKGNYINPYFTVGAGLDFSDNLGIDLAYQIGFDLYSNDYDVFGTSGNVKGTVSYGSSERSRTDGLLNYSYSDTADLAFAEISATRHAITPLVWYANSIGDLEFGLTLEIPFGIETKNTKNWTEETVTVRSGPVLGDTASRTIATTVTKQDGTTVDENSFDISPTLKIGGTYPLIADRLSINAGIGLSLPTFTSTTTRTAPGGFESVTTKTVNERGEVTVPETVAVTVPAAPNGLEDELVVENTWSGLAAQVSAGFTFAFNKNFSVDALASFSLVSQYGEYSGSSVLRDPNTGQTIANGTESGNIYRTTSMYTDDAFGVSTTTFSVLFTVKF